MPDHNSHEEEVVHNDDVQVQTASEAGTASLDYGKDDKPTTTANDNKNGSNGLTPSDPPLPNEAVPPLPEDDGWDPVWEPNAHAYYFYNRFTQASQWTNPRVPDAQPTVPGVGNYDRIPAAPGTNSPPPDQAQELGGYNPAAPGVTTPPSDQAKVHGGYNPAVHGDYDPAASYAVSSNPDPAASSELPSASTGQEIYTATGVFNRFTGKWQPHEINPENHNDENKSRRQMSAFFDVDAAANSHDGKSLKAERAGKKLSKAEVKAFKEKRKERKEEKRRAWLRD